MATLLENEMKMKLEYFHKGKYTLKNIPLQQI